MKPHTRMGTAAKALDRYHQKRNFRVTSEPRGRRPAKGDGALRFVVQKHDATRLHYDFRLEHEGTLWSWAVPKGPTLDPKERRLAARVEDHPIDYADFEGVIPKGEYGGGPVIVWDRGTWTPAEDPASAMKKGKLTFELDGEKLHGRFHLVRLRPRGKEKESWLLFKSKDAHAAPGTAIVDERPESVVSGKKIEDLQAPTSADAGDASDTSKMLEAVSALAPTLRFTNVDKVLFPDVDVRKGHVLAYYASVASRMLPLVGGRPLSLFRSPDGVTAKGFFQKHATTAVPKVIHRVGIVEGGEERTSMFIDDVPGLLALPQMGAFEIHTWLCRADRIDRPDTLIVDLDPDETLSFDRVVEAALDLRKRLDALGLVSFVKTTGGKGLHVVAPVARKLDWDAHGAFAHALVEAMTEAAPTKYVTNMRKDLRKGRIFLDYLRNGRGATAVAPYSLRARPGALVATPITWAELEKGITPKSFDLQAVLQRIRGADPWAGYEEAASQRIRS